MAPQPASSSPTPRVLVITSLVIAVIAVSLVLSSLTASNLPARKSQVLRNPKNVPAAVAGTTLPSRKTCGSGSCTYINDTHRFSLVYPSAWEAREGLFGTIVSLVTPLGGKNDQFSENINVVSEKVGDDMTLESYYKASEENLKKYFTQFKVVKVDTAQLGGVPARIVTYNATQGTVKLRTTQIFALNDGKAYIVTISNLQSSPTTNFTDMVKVADSFAFIK